MAGDTSTSIFKNTLGLKDYIWWIIIGGGAFLLVLVVVLCLCICVKKAKEKGRKEAMRELRRRQYEDEENRMFVLEKEAQQDLEGQHVFQRKYSAEQRMEYENRPRKQQQETKKIQYANNQQTLDIRNNPINYQTDEIAAHSRREQFSRNQYVQRYNAEEQQPQQSRQVLKQPVTEPKQTKQQPQWQAQAAVNTLPEKYTQEISKSQPSFTERSDMNTTTLRDRIDALRNANYAQQDISESEKNVQKNI